MIKIAILLMTTFVIVASIVCPPDYCKGIECGDPPITSCGEDYEFNPHGTFCGCCPTCVRLLEFDFLTKGKKMMHIAILLFLTTSVFVDSLLACPPDYCDTRPACEPITTCEEGFTLVPEATACGCCPACIKYLGIGEPCSEIIGSPPQFEKCRPGLVCRNNRCDNIR